MVNKVSRPRARKKKEQRQAASDDDEVDFLPALLPYIPSLIAGGTALYNAWNQSQPQDYDIGSVPEMGQWQDSIGGYGQGIDAYGESLSDYRGIAQDYMDPEGRMAGQMGSLIKQDAMDQIGMQNQLNSRDPFTNSGILKAQNRASTISGMTGANKNVAQMLLGLQQQGAGMMGNAMGMEGNMVGMQGNMAGMQGNYAQMFGQQDIANTSNQNAWNQQQGGFLGDLGIGLLQSMFSGGDD